MQALSAIDALAHLAKPFDALDNAQTAQHAAQFEAAMAQADGWHRQHNSSYNALWQTSTVAQRPLMPVALLKRADMATPVPQPGLWLSSSGSSGAAAAVQFDEVSLARIERGMRYIFAQAEMMGDTPARFLLLSPDPRLAPQPGYATSFLRFTACAPQAEVVFAVNPQGSFASNLAWETLQRWACTTEPVFVFGLTVFFEQLALSAPAAPLGLVAPVKGITGGGWKGVMQGLDRPEILQRLKTAFGAQQVDIRDIFGMTEHPLHYLSCTEQRFHIPHYSRCEILAADGQPAAYGQTGLIRLQNPFMRTLPSHDLLTEDLGQMGEGCTCGSRLPWLRFMGRATVADHTCAALAHARLQLP